MQSARSGHSFKIRSCVCVAFITTKAFPSQILFATAMSIKASQKEVSSNSCVLCCLQEWLRAEGGLKQVIVMIAAADTERNPKTIQYLQPIAAAESQMAVRSGHMGQTLRNLHRCSSSTGVAGAHAHSHQLAAIIYLHEAGRLRQHTRAADETSRQPRHAS